MSPFERATTEGDRSIAGLAGGRAPACVAHDAVRRLDERATCLDALAAEVCVGSGH